MIVAIDGPAGSGKTTTAKQVARKLGFLHLDTGAMYRCITLKGLRLNVPFTDEQQLGEMTRQTKIRFEIRDGQQHVVMDGVDVTEEIRSRDVTASVSDYCAVAIVRELLVAQQRRLGSAQDSVLEGRDIGTVVFPNADFKFYMVASIQERAKRRQKELAAKGIEKAVEELEKDIEERDRKDSSRDHSPLRKADDAVEVDTSKLTIEQQVQRIVNIVEAGKGRG